MTARKPCPPAPGPLEAYAQQFDMLFSSLAQRRGFRDYLQGLLLGRRLAPGQHQEHRQLAPVDAVRRQGGGGQLHQPQLCVLEEVAEAAGQLGTRPLRGVPVVMGLGGHVVGHLLILPLD